MDIKIIDYTPNLKSDFARLNIEWLEKYFVIEEVDAQLFNDPEREIIDKPGLILFAEVEGEIIGTGAMIWCIDRWELIKMAVTHRFQSRGVGKLLATNLIDRSIKMRKADVYIVTNTVLEKATNLYNKLGFVVTHRGTHAKYKRGNLVLELDYRKYLQSK